MYLIYNILYSKGPKDKDKDISVLVFTELTKVNEHQKYLLTCFPQNDCG